MNLQIPLIIDQKRLAEAADTEKNQGMLTEGEACYNK